MIYDKNVTMDVDEVLELDYPIEQTSNGSIHVDGEMTNFLSIDRVYV